MEIIKNQRQIPMIKIVAVSYLNTKPLVYGLEREMLPPGYELSFEIPSVCAQAIADGTGQIGLIPAFEYQRIPDLTIIPDIGIAAQGAVRTVLLVSEAPIYSLQSVILDYSSRTSNVLVQILLNRKYKQFPIFRVGKPEYEGEIRGGQGGVIIGDRAFRYRQRFPFVYDLALEWQEWTGLPFVFAFWAAKPGCLRADLLQAFQRSLDVGLEHIPEIAQEWARLHGGQQEVYESYLTSAIIYKLGSKEYEGLKLFFSLAQEQGLIPELRELSTERGNYTAS
jgi:chorismate dehydratase